MLNPTTFPSLYDLKLKNNKPLIICDADEVIFDFMTTFEKYLITNGLSFSWKSYALEGNILDKKNKPIDKDFIKNIINDFFKTHTYTMNLIKDAKDSLKKLKEIYNIIILSNIPFEFYDQRAQALKKHDINFSFYANQGPKGKAIKQISKQLTNKLWFIDDSPYQISSVKSQEKSIKTILFISNIKLKKLINHKKCWDYFSNKWKNNEKILFMRR